MKRKQMNDEVDSLAYFLNTLKKEISIKDINHICRSCNKSFNGTKTQTLCDSCIFEAEDKRLSEMTLKSQIYYRSVVITEGKLHREFNL